MRTRIVSNTLSRNQACLTCRSRKVRCNAARPGCDACRRSANARGDDPNEVVCVYITPGPWREEEDSNEVVEEEEVGRSAVLEVKQTGGYGLRKNRRASAKVTSKSFRESPSPSLSDSSSFNTTSNPNPNPNPTVKPSKRKGSNLQPRRRRKSRKIDEDEDFLPDGFSNEESHEHDHDPENDHEEHDNLEFENSITNPKTTVSKTIPSTTDFYSLSNLRTSPSNLELSPTLSGSSSSNIAEIDSPSGMPLILPPAQIQFNPVAFGGINPLALYAFLPSFENTSTTIDPRSIDASLTISSLTSSSWQSFILQSSNSSNSSLFGDGSSQLVGSPESGISFVSSVDSNYFDQVSKNSGGNSSSSLTGFYSAGGSYLTDSDLLNFSSSSSWSPATSAA